MDSSMRTLRATTSKPPQHQQQPQPQRVGIRSPGMKFIDLIAQKLQGRPQTVFKAIAVKAIEHHDRQDDPAYDNLPRAIMRNVRERMEPTDYMAAYAKAQTEWNRGKTSTFVIPQPAVPKNVTQTPPPASQSHNVLNKPNPALATPTQADAPKRTTTDTTIQASPTGTWKKNCIDDDAPHDDNAPPKNHAMLPPTNPTRDYAAVRSHTTRMNDPSHRRFVERATPYHPAVGLNPYHQQQQHPSAPTTRAGPGIRSFAPHDQRYNDPRYSKKFLPIPTPQHGPRPPTVQVPSPAVARPSSQPRTTIRAPSRAAQDYNVPSLVINKNPPSPIRTMIHTAAPPAPTASHHHHHHHHDHPITGTTASRSRSVMQLALRYGFALALNQLENGSPHTTVATMQERLEQAERKLGSMTPVEQDQMWDKIERIYENAGMKNI